MAINLATKYSGKIAEVFTKESFLQNNVNKNYDFSGVKTVNVYTMVTVPMTDYNRAATSDRFGPSTEMQDTIQTLTLSRDRAFSIIIDKGNNVDQMNIKGAAKMLKLEIDEQLTPEVDKYTLSAWRAAAGITSSAITPSKTNIVEAIGDGATAMDNALVPDNNRTIYIKATNYNLLRQAPEFLALENLGDKALGKGVVGSVFNIKTIKVPDSYLPADTAFMITYPESVLSIMKIEDTRILNNVKGVSGNVLEGRYYYDAFVLDAKKNGVYCALTA